MAETRPPKLPGRKSAERKTTARRAVERKPGSEPLRRLARTHTKAAVEALAEVAMSGTSEASRISAAMALLDRGYGKMGVGPSHDVGEGAAILYQRIELIDGTAQTSDQDHQAADSTD